MDVHLHHHQTHFRYEKLFPVLWGYAAALALTGFLLDSPGAILRGLATIVLSEASLITGIPYRAPGEYDEDYINGKRPFLTPALVTNGILAAELALKYLTKLETGSFEFNK